MALVGNLQDFGLLQLLRLINQSRKTGCLTIQSGQSTALLFFQEGNLSFGALADHRSVFREGLLKMGKVTQELDRYIFATYQPVTEKGLALLLEESGFLSRDEVVAQEAKRLQELMDLLFSWESGAFKFNPGTPPPLESVTVSLGLEGIIIEGSKRIQEIEVVNERVPDLNVVLRFANQKQEQGRSVNLGSDEWRVLTSVDGKTTIKAIAETHSLDEIKVRKLVYGLMSAGLVELEQGTLTVQAPSSPKDSMPTESVGARKSIILRLIDRVRGI